MATRRPGDRGDRGDRGTAATVSDRGPREDRPPSTVPAAARAPAGDAPAARAPSRRAGTSDEVILRTDVSDLGKRGDILDVSDGYARNYLVPKGLAMKASCRRRAQAASMRRARDQRDAQDRAAAERWPPGWCPR